MRLADAARPGLVATNIYNHDSRRPSDLMYAVVIRLLAQDADHGALPVLYAAVAGIPGNSFAGPSHRAHARRPGTHRPLRHRAGRGSRAPPLGRLRAAHRGPLPDLALPLSGPDAVAAPQVVVRLDWIAGGIGHALMPWKREPVLTGLLSPGFARLG